VSCVDDCHCGIVISAVVTELARSACNVLLGHCECAGPYPPNVGFCRASCRRLSLGLRQTDDSYSAWKDHMAGFSGTLVAFRRCLSIAPPICMELGNPSSWSCSRSVAARSAATPGQTWSDAAKPAGSCAILPPGGQFHQISLNFSQVSAWHRSTDLFPICNR